MATTWVGAYAIFPFPLQTMPKRDTPDLVSGSIQVRQGNEEQVVLHHIQEGRNGQLQGLPRIQQYVLKQSLQCNSQDLTLEIQWKRLNFSFLAVFSMHHRAMDSSLLQIYKFCNSKHISAYSFMKRNHIHLLIIQSASWAIAGILIY